MKKLLLTSLPLSAGLFAHSSAMAQGTVANFLSFEPFLYGEIESSEACSVEMPVPILGPQNYVGFDEGIFGVTAISRSNAIFVGMDLFAQITDDGIVSDGAKEDSAPFEIGFLNCQSKTTTWGRVDASKIDAVVAPMMFGAIPEDFESWISVNASAESREPIEGLSECICAFMGSNVIEPYFMPSQLTTPQTELGGN